MNSDLKSFKSFREVLLSDLENNILSFWSTKTQDDKYGGFFGHIDEHNNPITTASKGVVLNTRILWTFSASFLFFKDEKYKLIADRAYEYISDFFVDKKNNGVFWELDYNGNPLNTRKQIYAQAFTIYSFTEYYQASGDETALNTAIEIFNLIEKHSLDSVKGGYLEAFKDDWSPIQDFRLSEKDLNAPKTMNTHLHILEAYTCLYKVWKNDKLKDALRNLILLFLQKFLDHRGHLILFFDNDWKPFDEFCSYGHDIEFSWLLTEAAHALGDQELIIKTSTKAVEIATIISKEAIAADGGIMNEYHYTKQELDSDKHWWQQAEAMVGFFNAYHISKNGKFLESMLSVWGFIYKYIIDHKNGEWFWRVDCNGVVPPGMEKAGFWKCPYHNSRAAFELVERMDKEFLL